MAGVIDQFEADKHFFNGFEWGTCVQRIAKPDEELFTLGCCGPYPKDLLKMSHIKSVIFMTHKYKLVNNYRLSDRSIV